MPHEEKGEREEAVDESSLKWCAPRASTDQSPLQKRFRSTDTVGKRVEPTRSLGPVALGKKGEP